MTAPIVAKYRDFTVYESTIHSIEDGRTQTIYYTYIDNELVDSTEPDTIRRRIDEWHDSFPIAPPSCWARWSNRVPSCDQDNDDEFH